MQDFIFKILDYLPSLFAAVMLTLIGVGIGAVVFSGVWLFVFLWRKLIMKLLPRVYDSSRPGQFARYFAGALAAIPVVIILAQSLQTAGLNLDFVPPFFRVWIFVIGGFLIATPIILIRDFFKRKKPDSEISKQQG